MTQHDPLDARAAQQRAEDFAPTPLTIADLSELEREALCLLRQDEPRDLRLCALEMRNEEVYVHAYSLAVDLLRKGLAHRAKIGFYFRVLTAEGARLQAELFEQGGGG